MYHQITGSIIGSQSGNMVAIEIVLMDGASLALDLLQVSLLINKQTGGKKKKKTVESGRERGRRADLLLLSLPFFSSSSLPFVY